MLRISAYAVILIAIISSCAQPGVLTGGEKDEVAPRPLFNKSSPQQAIKNIEPKRIDIAFDEYFTLSNPQKNIVITPNTLDFKAKMSGKRLVLDLEGEYLENTTYTVSLNRAVKDLSEGNDSLVFFVFSTGNEIDQGKANFIVQDAYSNVPVKDYVVGLFNEEIPSDSSAKPIYIGQSSNTGEVKFNYLKEQDYFVYAFNDINKNGAYDKGEAGGRLKEAYTISDSLNGVVPILLVNKQEESFRINQNLQTPGIWSFKFTQPVDSSQVLLDNEKLVFRKWNETEDSVAFYFEGLEKLEELEMIYSGDKKDTLSKKYFPDLKVKLTYEDNRENAKLPYGKDFSVVFNDVIKEVDSTKILSSDGRSIPTKINGNELLIAWEDLRNADSLEIDFIPSSIAFANFSQEDTLSFLMSSQKVSDVGNIIVKADSIFPQGFLELLKQNKVIQQQRVNTDSDAVQFKNLQPGSYTFKFVYDTDNNGEWTGGSIYENKSPEKVVWFSESSKLRANWEIETTLQFE